MKSRKPGSIEKAKGSRTAALQDEKHKTVLLPCFALVLIDVGAVGGEESRRDQKELCLFACNLSACEQARLVTGGEGNPWH